MDDRDDFNSRTAVHDAMAHFTYHWAPSQPRKAAEFQADLLRLIQAVHRDSAKPMEVALTKAFSAFPIATIFPPKPSGQTELYEACKLALKYWHSDHPNDTVDAQDARAKIEAALSKAEGQG